MLPLPAPCPALRNVHGMCIPCNATCTSRKVRHVHPVRWVEQRYGISTGVSSRRALFNRFCGRAQARALQPFFEKTARQLSSSLFFRYIWGRHSIRKRYDSSDSGIFVLSDGASCPTDGYRHLFVECPVAAGGSLQPLYCGWYIGFFRCCRRQSGAPLCRFG